MWPTIVILSLAFIGVSAGLAFANMSYLAATALIINAPAACALYLLQRADYQRVKARIPAVESGGLNLPVVIGLP